MVMYYFLGQYQGAITFDKAPMRHATICKGAADVWLCLNRHHNAAGGFGSGR